MSESVPWLPCWYVAFLDASDPPWWLRGLRPGFGHCEAFAWDDAAGCWIVAGAHLDVSVVRALPGPAFAAYQAELHRRGAVIVLAKAQGGGRWRLAAFSCVSLVASLLGLPGLCAVRPYGLYRKLLALGAMEVTGP